MDCLCELQSLRALRINLHEESQVDYLLRRLEGLEELNGLAVEREALFNDEEEAQEEATEEEQFEDANDFVHPNNVVLEESNEDGTISVDNYGNNGGAS